MSNNREIARHYAKGGLVDGFRAYLANRDSGEAPEWKEFAAVDQFHVGGLAATMELAARLPLGGDVRVLDVGCGLGGPARCLAATTGCHVTGLDATAEYVAVAHYLGGCTGLAERTSWVVGDAVHLPFPGKTFEVGWTQHAAMNIRNRVGLYQEFARVIKPGGVLAVHDVVAGSGAALTYPTPWAAEESMSFLLTAEETAAAIERVGFRVESWNDSTQSGLTWLAEARKQERPASELPDVRAPGFGKAVGNLAQNLESGSAGLLQAVFRLGA